jgi:hypothetical protein
MCERVHLVSRERRLEDNIAISQDVVREGYNQPVGLRK